MNSSQSEPVSAVLLAAREAHAHLRAAQSHIEHQEFAAAKTEYAKIAANPAYLPHHRSEAEELLGEMERVAKGLPARDPKASRVTVPHLTEFALELWVGPEGHATNPGTAACPFATLSQARDALRRLKSAGLTGAALVRIKPGEYPLTDTFALTADDSGTETAPVVYRAEQKGTVVFQGGVRIRGFIPVTDPGILSRLPETARGKVLQCDLRQQGITDFGELATRGFGLAKATIPTLEVYGDGKPMTPARWPNDGFAQTVRILESGVRDGTASMTFEYQDDRAKRWTTAKDAWLFGYWKACWADAAIKMGTIDPSNRQITTAQPFPDGIDPSRTVNYYAFNLLEELDQPGEWYLDRDSGVLYLYPPSDPKTMTVEVSLLSVPMVTMNHVSHVRFEGLTFELARHDGIVIHGGERCILAGCTIRRLAGDGVRIDGGLGHVVLGCDLHTLGRGGVIVKGGNRQTLESGGHVVENCHIHNFSRIDRTYTPAVLADGVGSRIAHNLLHDSPCHAIRIAGNDHIVEWNDVHSVVRESDDQGAVDMFGNPTFRGVVFRYNYFHHVGNGGHQQAGIRLDDAICGVLVYGNVFYRTAFGNLGAVQINSGRENIVENNIFADCLRDLSGGWTPGWSENNTFWKLVAERKSPEWTDYIMSDLYLTRYPLLKNLYESPPINFIWRNVLWNCGERYLMNENHVDTTGVLVYKDENPGFADPTHQDFRLRPDAPLIRGNGFRPIPVDEIGLYHDEYRATWPVSSTPVDVPDWRAIRG
jgi:hypothetical protein